MNSNRTSKNVSPLRLRTITITSGRASKLLQRAALHNSDRATITKTNLQAATTHEAQKSTSTTILINRITSTAPMAKVTVVAAAAGVVATVSRNRMIIWATRRTSSLLTRKGCGTKKRSLKTCGDHKVGLRWALILILSFFRN